MPELPEVETIMCGLKPHLEGAIIQEVIIRRPHLRWPIPQHLNRDLKEQQISTVSRRGKYLLIRTDNGTLLIHLGMSGSLQMVTSATTLKSHDHVDIILSDDNILRYNDPRRFGAILWTTEDPYQHKLLSSLGVEPLESDFTHLYLQQKALNRRVAIKPFIMDSHVVVGVGNIYAAEALFLAKLHPNMPAGMLSLIQSQQLVDAIQTTLRAAIRQGGTTLKDFVNSEGKPGYFAQQLHVYGRAGKPCIQCQTTLQSITLGQRSTVFCEYCQPPLST